VGDLSEHFSMAELTVHPSTPELDNTPDPESAKRLSKLANYILERERSKLGVPIKINSAFRSMEVNQKIGGALLSSHMFGCAADTVPIGMDILTAYQVLMHDAGLLYDQLIYEQKGSRDGHTVWIHIGMESPQHPVPRRQALIYGPLTSGQYPPFDTKYVSFT
jgi:zinc D-Ala-D-Ala carboxypeptidase